MKSSSVNCLITFGQDCRLDELEIKKSHYSTRSFI